MNKYTKSQTPGELLVGNGAIKDGSTLAQVIDFLQAIHT